MTEQAVIEAARLDEDQAFDPVPRRYLLSQEIASHIIPHDQFMSVEYDQQDRPESNAIVPITPRKLAILARVETNMNLYPNKDLHKVMKSFLGERRRSIFRAMNEFVKDRDVRTTSADKLANLVLAAACLYPDPYRDRTLDLPGNTNNYLWMYNIVDRYRRNQVGIMEHFAMDADEDFERRVHAIQTGEPYAMRLLPILPGEEPPKDEVLVTLPDSAKSAASS